MNFFIQDFQVGKNKKNLGEKKNKKFGRKKSKKIINEFKRVIYYKEHIYTSNT